MCWGNDLIRVPQQSKWGPRRFVGTSWQVLHDEAKVAYQINTYRVLLTRARYETIIWVPEGDAADRTRNPGEFSAIADFLLACGALPLDDQSPITSEPTAALLL